MGINKKFVAKNGVDNNSQRLTNVAYPLDPSDATNKTYVDNMAAGLDTKQSVKVATTSNITLSGSQTIDAVNVVGSDRVLVKNQTNASENGIYVVNQVGSWTRSSDTQSWEKLPGAFTFVEKGTVNADTGWVCISDPSGTVGVTSITWTQFAGTGTITAGTGISVSGTQVSLSTISDTGVGSLKKITRDGYGRVTGTADVTATDITNLTNLLSNAAGAALGTSGASGTSPAVSRADHVHPLPTSLQVNNGTAAAPSLSFLSDPDTGIYKPNNDTFAISTLGSERLRIDNSGNVGIGTNTPGYPLDIGANAGQRIARVNGGSTNAGDGSALYLKTGTTTHSVGNLSAITGGAYSSDLALWSGLGNTVFYNSGGEKVRIDATGNVGIGTNSPAYKLQVYGGTAAVGGGGIDGRWHGINNNNVHVMDFGIGTLSGYPDSIGLTNTTSTGSLDFGTNNQIRMRINSNGKIGVNTNNPKGKVEIFNQNGFIPSNSTVANAALVVAGEYGGGITLVDGANYSSLYNIGGRFSIGCGTASGVMERLTIDSTGNVGLGTATPSSYSSAYSKVLTTVHGDQGITVGSYYQSGVNQYGFINAGGANNGWETPLVFQTGGTEKVRIDAGGNVGIGETNPSGWNSKLMVRVASGYVQSTVLSQGNTSSDIAVLTVAANGGTYSVTPLASGDGHVQIHLNGAAGKDRRIILSTSNNPRWAYGVSQDAESGSNRGSDFFLSRYADNGVFLGQTRINRFNGAFAFETSCAPSTDNLYSTGGASNRWSVVYAGTGTINTSDAREKNEVRSLTEAEISAAQALSKEIGAYKFLSAIAEKGDAAREHIGMTVQRAIEIMESFGLVPFNYGFICYDEWDTETQTIPAVEASDAVIGENGDVVVPAVEAKPEEIKVIREAGNRYSFRMDELSMFISRGLVAKLESIEARLAALEV